MSVLFWFDTSVYGFAAVLAAGLSMLSLSVGRGAAVNRIFAVFTFLVALSSVTAVLVRISLMFGAGYPSFWLHVSAFAFCLMGPVLLIFSAMYCGWRSRVIHAASLAGVAVISALSYYLFSNALLSGPRLGGYGQFIYDISPMGLSMSAIPLGYYAWSFYIFWKMRKKTGENFLFTAVSVLMAGFILGGLIRLDFPVMPAAITVCVLCLGHALVRRQILNPLKEYNVELEAEVSRRTEELSSITEELRIALKEKELLIREIHHRIKNNIQIILGLFGIYCTEITDHRMLRIFREVEQRIKTILLVHEMLYKSDCALNISFSEYLRCMIGYLSEAYDLRHRNIRLNEDIEPIELGMTQSINIGLIFTELFSNAMKYAFPDDVSADKVITVTVKDAGGSVRLEISDNGIGLPGNVDMATTGSFGLSMVYLLATQQMKGSISVESGSGTRFVISIPIEKP